MTDIAYNTACTLPENIILWGGTGQAKVMRPIIEHYGSRVAAVFDDTADLLSPFPDVKIYHGWDNFRNWIKNHNPEQYGFCITIGNPHGNIRRDYHKRLLQHGLSPVKLIHPECFISKNAEIGAGAQVHAGAVVETQVKTGIQCIINTKASVDHECILEDGVEIAPGATLCGLVHVEENSWVGAGATILPRIRIGHDSIVGAGAVVTEDVADHVTVAGVPAKIIRTREAHSNG
ncbi:MAG: acetyltransferase [bacterium]